MVHVFIGVQYNEISYFFCKCKGTRTGIFLYILNSSVKPRTACKFNVFRFFSSAIRWLLLLHSNLWKKKIIGASHFLLTKILLLMIRTFQSLLFFHFCWPVYWRLYFFRFIQINQYFIQLARRIFQLKTPINTGSFVFHTGPIKQVVPRWWHPACGSVLYWNCVARWFVSVLNGR